MNNKFVKTKENNENLCPKRKRLPSKSFLETPAWKLAKLDTTSSPSALTNEYLEEMGIGMLDSEESSSSAASAIALAVTASADENSNEATPNLDAPKFLHQQRQIYRNMDTSLLDASTDNASNHSFLDPNDTYTKTTTTNNTGQQQHKLNMNNNSNSSSSFDIYTDEQQTIQKLKTTSMDKFQLPQNATTTGTQQKKIAILGMGASVIGTNAQNGNSPSSGGRNTRSPLATVACNSFLRNAQKQQLLLQQQQQQLQQQATFTNALPQRSQSPSMLPSTSHQAALLKQQQLQKQYMQQHCQIIQHQQQPRFVPNDSFFLFRNQTMRDRNPDGKDHFNTLSDEIILQIFNWLPKKALLRCGHVCRRFNRCASDESLWTRLDLGGRSIKAGAMENIVKRGVVILRLAQAELNHPIFEQRFLEDEPTFESKLQYLDLSMVSVTKPSLKMLLTRCRRLKKLSLEHIALNDEICNEIAKNAGLEALNLAMCSGLEAWSVRKLMESLKHLNSLNISWTNLSVDAVTSLVTNVTPSLRRLNVAGCRKTMFDSHLVSLCKRCPQLLELDLSDCTGLTGNAINILCKFQMLEYLSLSRCYLIPATAYIELHKMLTLKFLDIFGMLTDSALKLLEATFSNIGINKYTHSCVARPTVGTRRTSIWGLRTRRYNDTSDSTPLVNNLILNHPIFEQRFLEAEPTFESKLQYLDLSMVTVTKPSLKMLLKRCRQLKKLSLEHVALNDEICNEIAKNTGLEALNLAMCSGLEAWSVRKLMETLKHLNSLNISWTNLSVDAVTSLVTNVTPNLMRLNVAGCRKTMFDSHLASLCKRCPQLLELDLSDCTGLTGNAISIICKFPMLEYLSLSRCYLIPATAYIDLQKLSTLTHVDIFGMLTDSALEMLEGTFSKIGINKFIHSSVARPTVGTRRTSIWGLRTRD